VIADEATLSRLMRASQQGDRDAYATLLVEARSWLKRFLGRKVPPHYLDDLVQDVLISLHTKRATFDPARPFLPWLAAIARYRWVDHLRRVYRSEETALLDMDATVPSQEDAVLSRISLDRLLHSLPPAQAQAIALVKIEGHSIAEAAGQTGQSESLVKVNIHRGLRKLAALVEEAD
jgi:RNA polymerase sigma factor (sigma-70 family)